MKKVTVEQFMAFNPCYSEEEVKRIAGRKKYWSAIDILKLEKVPADDRLWAVLRPELIDESIMHEFACCCAEEALKLVEEPDPRSIEAIRVKRLWIKGEATNEELAAARDAAWAAARDAAWDAARAAAWDAAGDAAWDAARDAAGDAAWDAAWDAARAAARAAQVKLLIDLLEEGRELK